VIDIDKLDSNMNDCKPGGYKPVAPHPTCVPSATRTGFNCSVLALS
jgi:hypothetical protein